MTRSWKYADNIVEWLVELGYTHCFFVAGGNIMHLLDAARIRLTCIPVVHEVAAGIAAEYFNESEGTGRAFALVTAGPGVSNIVTAMAGAWLESRELLVIAGQVKSTDLASNGLRQRGIQEIDGVGLTTAVTKASTQASIPMTKSQFTDLVEMGRGGRRGPVFIEFCLDVQGGRYLDDESLMGISPPPSLQRATQDEIETVVAGLRSAERPILLIGGGVDRKTAWGLQNDLGAAGIPLMTTWNGADRVDARNPLYFGRPNTWGQRAANLLLGQSDFLIAVGTRLGLQQTGFNWRAFASHAFVVHVDIDQSELEKGHPRTDQKVCADANDFLRRLLRNSFPDWTAWIRHGRKVNDLLPLNDPENQTSKGFVSPYEFCLELSDLSEPEDIIVPCSSGGANSVPMQTISPKLGQIVITDKGLASMGYGLSGAIGVALAHPGRRVLLIEGDGGFSQNLQELATVSVNRLPIKVFIFANNGYGSIRMTQKNYFDGAYLGCDEKTGLGFPDWTKLFESYGIRSLEIDDLWRTNDEVAALLASSEPAGFIVPVDPLQTYWPKITSRITEAGSMESNPLYEMSPDLPAEIMEQVTRFL